MPERRDTNPDDRRLGLLPVPRQFRQEPGECAITRLRFLPGNSLESTTPTGLTVLLDQIVALADASPGPTREPIPLHVAWAARNLPNYEAYRLIVRPDLIEVAGASPAGCHHGLQTLRQLIESSDDRTLPCCEILDWPDFDTRGLLLDVTRGRVPTLETLKLLADRLASLKCNQLQLNIEHAFVFSFDPEICGPNEGLTPDEIRELDAYCRERFIDLVPALATFGHMGRVLSMPKYRHLAEVEAVATWEKMTWPQRMRGFTLDCANPEAHALVERMWSDMLEAFSAPVVNICGDEPHDLGRGKNRERFAGRIGQAYLELIRRTYDICVRRGRRVQFWSDVVRNHPDLFHLVPRESTVMHWGYDDRADYHGTQALVDAGLDVIVCPGTSGWKRIVNGMNLAERNIATLAEVGQRYGATGLVNTDWGDHGHFNMLGCSWHGIALGAAKAWRADHPIREAFDRLFAAHVLGLSDPEIITLLREAARSGDECETWRQLWMPADSLADDATIPSADVADAMYESAAAAANAIHAVPRKSVSRNADLDELEAACAFLRLWTAKTKSLRCADRPPATSGHAELFQSATDEYRRLWLLRSKPAGLREIESALSEHAQPSHAARKDAQKP